MTIHNIHLSGQKEVEPLRSQLGKDLRELGRLHQKITSEVAFHVLGDPTVVVEVKPITDSGVVNLLNATPMITNGQ